MTLCFVQDGQRILLGYKKQGFGAGRWNGFGGKVKPGESIEDAAKRELEEECGIVASRVERRGLLTFEFEGSSEVLEVYVLRASRYRGAPVESTEMRPQWFRYNEIPFDHMWPDDRHWLPVFLAGKKFCGSFLFRQTVVGKPIIEADTLIRYHVEEVRESTVA